ncbi:hypothetical protein LPJ66_007629 [Kickxella alabastrina]|uniref:Uncharacterized protein n=1 Tax=Kickxella alabastrina TaxID=61397 RepID=A0ACC1IGN8_9FUNG|nr:hypothetical protein LPJ66_007629 [Kickxella alabastrina]
MVLAKTRFNRLLFLSQRSPFTTTSTMTIATATAHFATRTLPAYNVELTFSSTLDDGAFSATGSDTQWIAECCKELRRNRCVGLPTETVYGLAANALDAEAVSAIYAAKARPSDNPLIVHVSSMRMLRALYYLPPASSGATPPFLGTANAGPEGAGAGLAEPVAVASAMADAEARDREQGGDGVWPEIPRAYHAVIRRFWPGPLTLVLPRPACVPLAVLGGHGDTVAFRFPAHPVARAAISACGLPLAAPSANASGRPSPTAAAHVMHDLSGRLPLIVDAGACDVGVESTVLDAYSATAHVDGELAPCILRPGGVTYEDLRALGGMWQRLRVYRRDFTSAALELAPTTPGMKYRHYAPTAPVHVFVPGPQSEAISARMQAQIDTLALKGVRKVGVVAVAVAAAAGDDVPAPAFVAPAGCELIVHCVGGARELAHSIFALLRELDEIEHVEAILVQGVVDANEGLAVMNRLTKAASHHVLC